MSDPSLIVSSADGKREVRSDLPADPPESVETLLGPQTINSTLRNAGVDYQVPVDGVVDFKALGRALGKRYPKITQYLAE